MRQLRLYLMSIAIVFPAPSLLAEPSAEVQRLMDQPATMFDIGLARIEHELAKTDLNEGYDDVPIVNYDFTNNRIQILFFKTFDNRAQDQWRSSCEAGLPAALRYIDNVIYHPLFRPFTHRGWSKSNEPDEDQTNLSMRAITEVELRVRIGSKGIYARGCKATLGKSDESGPKEVTFEDMTRKP